MGGSNLAQFLAELTRRGVPGKEHPPIIVAQPEETMQSILARLQHYENDPCALIVFEEDAHVHMMLLSTARSCEATECAQPQKFGLTTSVSMLYHVAEVTGETLFTCGEWTPTSRAQVSNKLADLIPA